MKLNKGILAASLASLALAIFAFPGVRASGVERSEATAAALVGLDFAECGYTPWAAMHLFLVIGEQGRLTVAGRSWQCLQLLSSDELAPGALLAEGGRRYAPRSAGPVFAHELEDHHAQFFALRAQALHDRTRAGDLSEWMACAEALLELAASRRGAEREWLLILGGLVARHLPAGELRDEVHAETQALLRDFLRGEGMSADEIPACGSMHGATALQICFTWEDLDPELRTRVNEALQGLAATVRNYRHEDGYVEFPGLHYPFEAATDRDVVRVLGHIVEWWSYDSTGAWRDDVVVEALEDSIGRLEGAVARGELHSKEVGELCHAIGALRRIRR